MEASRQPPLRVLLVEDSAILRERLTESLSVPGSIEIVGYADTEAGAIRLLAEKEWDALVLDLQLREGTGLGVLRVLQRQGLPAARTTIVFTNYAFPQYRAKSAQLGAHHFLDKSRDYHRLREILEQLAAG